MMWTYASFLQPDKSSDSSFGQAETGKITARVTFADCCRTCLNRNDHLLSTGQETYLEVDDITVEQLNMRAPAANMLPITLNTPPFMTQVGHMNQS
jgi:hypothetical protein